MLVVSVELHSAITGKKKVLGRTLICNTGMSAEPTRGDYSVHVANKRDVDNVGQMYHKPQRSGSVENYPRLSYNVWRLVIRALLSAFPEEKAK